MILKETQEERTRIEPDQEPFDDSYIDTWGDQTQEERDKTRSELWGQIEAEGVWGIIREKRCHACGQWEHVDSIWGIVPGNGYTLENAAEEYGLLV